MDVGSLIFVILSTTVVVAYFVSATIGVIRPKTFLRLQKNQAKWFGKFFGFEAKPYPDEILCKRIRYWSIFSIIWGLFVLFLIFKNI